MRALYSATTMEIAPRIILPLYIAAAGQVKVIVVGCVSVCVMGKRKCMYLHSVRVYFVFKIFG